MRLSDNHLNARPKCNHPNQAMQAAALQTRCQRKFHPFGGMLSTFIDPKMQQ
jgi:hypothetical protein